MTLLGKKQTVLPVEICTDLNASFFRTTCVPRSTSGETLFPLKHGGMVFYRSRVCALAAVSLAFMLLLQQVAMPIPEGSEASALPVPVVGTISGSPSQRPRSPPCDPNN